MRAFVTGGTGFVGKPFVRRLLADGWDVTLSTRNRAHAEALGEVRVVEGDLADAAAMARAAEGAEPFDVVFHLGAAMNYFGDPETLRVANVEATRNVLDLAIRTGSKKFVYASSIEAVGTVAEVPAPHDVPCRPVSTYGASKVLAEGVIREKAAGRFPAVILRIGNVYGTDQFSFLFDVADAILTRNRLLEFLPVYGKRRMQPVHNRDVTEGLLAAARSDVKGVETVTLAGEHASMEEMFRWSAEALGRTLHPRKPGRGDEIFLKVRHRYHRYRRQMDLITYIMAGRGKRVHRAYDLEHTYRTIGFRPSVPLRQGIHDFLAWTIQQGHVDPAA